jgi:hypothetical protein
MSTKGKRSRRTLSPQRSLNPMWECALIASRSIRKDSCQIAHLKLTNEVLSLLSGSSLT